MGMFKQIKHIIKLWPNAIGKAGLHATLQWTFSRIQRTLHIPSPKQFLVRPRFLAHPVRLRARTSDPSIFQEVMIEEEYLPLTTLRLKTILDLGSNIGLSSAWFLSRFPEAEVFAVEAEAENYVVCCQNLAKYGWRARTFHGAAWSKRINLALLRSSSAAGNSVQETPVGDSSQVLSHVQGWDLASLIEMSGFHQVDLLKIDIEGAEDEIFRADISYWLPFVRNICIELHGQKCRNTFFGALTGYAFEHSRSGSIDLCTNLRLETSA